MHNIELVSIVVPVYRDGKRAVAAVSALLKQTLPANVRMEILVVDDGSDDDTPILLSKQFDSRVKVMRLPRNLGRSKARNAGAAEARGDIVLFMDSDCLPADSTLIKAHLQSWDEGVVASVGAVVGEGKGFWAHYQGKASERRARQHAKGIHYSGSSQNLLVSRIHFDTLGGFDEEYRTYGFEDRDLQVRLSKIGKIVWAGHAVVKHTDEFDLPAVCRKMREAGGKAAILFSQRHPIAYQALGYAVLDARLHPWLRFPAWLFSSSLPRISHYANQAIAMRFAPYWLKSALVKVLTGLSYLTGTAQKT